MKNKLLKGIGLSITSLFVSFSIGCGESNNEKTKIITTIFPEYDWVMNVLGDKKDSMDVSMLLDGGVDLHSYSPSPKDIINISNCDMFVYVGGESDEWVDDVLKDAKNKDMQVINLMEVLGDKAKEEELVEGMQGEDHDHEEGEDHDHEEGEDHDHEEGEDHDHEDGEDHDHEEGEGHHHHHDDGEKEYDEHVWLSLKNSQLFVDEIAKSLGEIDKDNADYYKNNAASYNNSLKDLDVKYGDAVKAGTKNTLLFADRFPFRYLVDDYSLNYYAAFIGCSAETEASFETIAFLANKVDELNLNAIIKIESSDGKIANTVKNSTKNKNQNILTMDSIQSATTKEYKEGRNYLSIMTSNLDVLKEALK
ncbi:MAG: metal ABC transporter substrate-binding protein [Bacilli bacterium]|nr:metal ABC transporter substrate-binding protein [Bacilli bacterium]